MTKGKKKKSQRILGSLEQTRTERIYTAIIDQARSHVGAIVGIQDQLDYQVVMFRVSWCDVFSQVRNWRRTDLFRRCIEC
jgi:hypothetical protein